MLNAILLAAALGLLPVNSALAQIVVLGGGDAHDCYLAAERGDAGSEGALRVCSRALEATGLPGPARAASQVNYGILLMRHGDHGAALAAFDEAIRLRPSLAEAHINRGASLIHLGRHEEAVHALTTSLELGTDHGAEAYYNRAIALQRSGGHASALADARRALELRPGWDAPARMLERERSPGDDPAR